MLWFLSAELSMRTLPSYTGTFHSLYLRIRLGCEIYQIIDSYFNLQVLQALN